MERDIKYIALFFVLMLPLSVTAGEYMGFESKGEFFDLESKSVVVGVFTTHISSDGYIKNDKEYDYHESNDYLALKFNSESGYEISLARLNNSYHEESYAVGIHKDLYKQNDYVSYGAELFLSSGYKEHRGIEVMPAPSLYVRIDNEYIGVKVSVLALEVVAGTVEVKF